MGEAFLLPILFGWMGAMPVRARRRAMIHVIPSIHPIPDHHSFWFWFSFSHMMICLWWS
jgi:hypothetical protein